MEANSKLAVSDSIIAIAGPGVAGGLVQILGAPKAIVADAASYILSALWLGGIGAGESRPVVRRANLWCEIGEGVRALLETPLLRVLTLTSSLGMLAGAMQGTLLILFLSRQLRFSPAVIGLAFACSGVGSLLGALGARRAAKRMGAGRAMILGKAAWLIGSLLVALAGIPGSVLSLVVTGQLLAGIGSTIYFVTQISLAQTLTSVQLLGRVTATRRFVLFGVAAAGSALAGMLGGAIGLRATLLLAVAALAAELALLVFSPVRHFRA